MFLRCCKQAFTCFVFRLVSLIISDRHIRSCHAIQRHNGLVETISHTVPIELHCNQLECLLNGVRIKLISTGTLVRASSVAPIGTFETCVSVGYCRGLSSLPTLGLLMCAVYTVRIK
jgi:hypothetical protein